MRFLVALVLVDVPVLIGVAVAGWFYGYADTYTAVMDYRMQHWWTFLPSLVLVAVLVRHWRRT